MKNQTVKKVIKSLFSVALGLSLGNSFSVTTAYGNEVNVEPKLESQQLVGEDTTVTAKASLEGEFTESRLYKHQWKNKDVVTVQYKNIPLLTFLYAPGNDAMSEATKFVETLEKLSADDVDAKEITVNWNEKTKDYSIKYQKQELIRINKYVRLPDAKANTDSSVQALQATNRIRRLISNAEPLKEIKGKPKQIAKVQKTNPNVVKSRVLRTYQGVASWYGPGFHGRTTANGERYNQNALTAAHRSLPFGTKIKVTNMKNGRSVIVRINDRGPYIGGRIVDLSAAAAQVIGMKSSGVAPVKLQVLGR